MRNRTGKPKLLRRGAGRSPLLIAIAVSLLLASAAILLSRTVGSGGTGTTPELNEADIPDITGPVGDVPDIRDGGGIGPARNAVVKLKDRANPARIAWEIEFAALDPAADEDLVDIDRPRAWYFVGENQAVYIRADAAQFVMPDISSEPESGRFEGNVELLQMDRLPDGSLPEPLPELSAVRITTDWLDFDALAGELSTTDPVTVLSERVEAECQGVRLVINEVDSRLEYFEVPGSIVATILPPAAGDDEPSDPAPVATPGAPGAAQPRPAQDSLITATPEQPTEQYYTAIFQGGVEVSQPNRRLAADRALAWIAMTDNRLDTDRLSSVPPSRSVALPIEAAVVSLALASHAAAQPAGVDADELGFDQPVRFEAQGPAIIRPSDARPPELEGGEILAVRFEADPAGRVTFSDSALPAEGDADAVEYGFATKLLSLIGRTGAPSRTTLTETGTLVAETVSIGLSTGVGQATGAGVLTDALGERSVTWQDQADVVFRVENGWMTGSIEQAVASGRVLLLDGETRITADDINARFARADESAVIERAVLTGGVSAETARGTLRARRADVRFLVEDERSTPHLAIATGEVVGEQDGQRISANQIEADLAPSTDGRDDTTGGVDVTAARASGTVRYDRDDGTFAEGDAVAVDAVARTVVVQGAPGSVGTADALVEGVRIELDESTAAITVPTRGRFTLTDERSEPLVHATWSDRMRFDDSSGALEAAGAVEIIATPAPGRRDTIRGDTVSAIVESLEGNDTDGAVADRRLVSAIATGTSETPASAESLRAEPGSGPDDTPERVLLLIGERIESDNAAGVLSVPGPGRLLVADRRLPPEETNEDSLRGSALFDWDGSMLLDRPAGRASMTQRVRLVHRPLDPDRGIIELESERLVTAFDAEGETRLTDPTRDAQLRAVDADGAVWARSGDQQILADSIRYDPATGAARASAAPGGWVTLFDPGQVAPVTAALLEWDIDDGRVQILRPSPVSVPR
ncbi:MAG: hypothetical protein ACTS22_00995 [Phycisphaerales bacterium]